MNKNTNMDKLTYGQRLKLARKRAKLTQPALAKKVGIKQPSISGIETGEYSTSTHTVAFARACGVSAQWLETGKGDIDASTDGWPFKQITKQRYDLLTDRQKEAVEEWIELQIKAFAGR